MRFRRVQLGEAEPAGKLVSACVANGVMGFV